MILHGIEYQRPTSLNMRILADHVTYSFLAFMKSIFHFCLGCYCGGYSQNGRSNLSSCHWWVWVQRFHHWMRCWCNHVSRRNHWGEILICNQFTTIFNCTKLLTSTSDSVAYARHKSMIMAQPQLVSSVLIVALEFLLNQSEYEWCHL